MIRQKTVILYVIIICFSFPAIWGQNIEIRKPEINTEGNNELAPVLQDSTLFFISNRRTNLLVTYMDQNEELLYQVFQARLNPDGTFSPTKLFAPPDRPRFNAGPVTFSPNGNTMIATHNLNQGSRKDDKNKLGLYTAQKRNGAWQNYQKISIPGSDSYSTGQPSLSADGRTLFFVSEMEGGFGSTDIYVSKKTGDTWSSPKNLGSNVNTPGKELFPFIHPNGKLYFSSDGHNGKGGFDIFSINLEKDNAVAVPLPAPVNTEFNDFSCFIFNDEMKGYFASDREGDDNIFEFTIPQIACSNPSEVKEDNFCYTLYEDSPFQSDTLPYIFRWDFGDGESGTGLEVDHCFPGPGNYHIQLNVIDTLTNEELFSVASYDLKLERNKQIWFEVPDTLSTNASLELQAEISGLENVPDNPVFHWDFGNGETRIGKNIVYIYQTPGNYRITCSTMLNDKREVCFYRDVTVTSR